MDRLREFVARALARLRSSRGSSDPRRREQRRLCDKYRAPFDPPRDDEKVGISFTVKDGLRPIHGQRFPKEGDTCGWYIWAGEDFSEDPDFFVPLHVSHVGEWCPEIEKFLALPPGWKFIAVPGEYERVAFDGALLKPPTD